LTVEGISPTPKFEEETQERARPGRRNRVVVLVFGLSLAYLLLAVFQRLNHYDDGLRIEPAERILRGELPYRDFWSGATPGQFYTLAAVFRVFRTSVLVERIWVHCCGSGFASSYFSLRPGWSRKKPPRFLSSLWCCFSPRAGIMVIRFDTSIMP
jgi:hypothetical protein